MRAAPRVVNVTCIGPRRLRVVFTDGLVRELDFGDTLQGVMAAIDSDEAFALVEVDEIAGTVSWPTGIDIDPDVLHGDFAAASGLAPKVLAEYQLQETK